MKQEIKLVLVKKFREMLTKEALTWYSLLPKNSIGSFIELADALIKEHTDAQKVLKRDGIYLQIQKGSTKLLREFVDWFQKERMLSPEVPYNQAILAFSNNLNQKSSHATRMLKDSLQEFSPITQSNLYYRYSTKLPVEEDKLLHARVDSRACSKYNDRSMMTHG